MRCCAVPRARSGVAAPRTDAAFLRAVALVWVAAAFPAGACGRPPSPAEPTPEPVVEKVVERAVEKTQTRPWSSADGEVTLHLPASWTVTPQPLHDSEVLSLWAAIPGGESQIGIYVYSMTNTTGSRGRLMYERAAALRYYDAENCETHLGADVSWCVVDDVRDPNDPWRRAYATRMVRGNAFVVRAFVRPNVWHLVERAFAEAARTLETRLSDWPEVPAGSRTVPGERWTYYLSDRVRDADVAPLDAFLREREAVFLSRTGELPSDPGAPFQVLVYGPGQTGPAPLFNQVAFGWIDHRQLWARPLGDSAAGRATLAGEWESMLWTRAWGPSFPWWIKASVSVLAESEVLVGAPLPAASESLAALWPERPAPFAEVAGWSPDEIHPDRVGDVVAWLATFRGGPEQIRAAWDACIREAVATCDWDRAQRHLLDIDPTVLRQALSETRASLTVRQAR